MYRKEMKILKEEKALLADREQAMFDRFLDRCKDAYEDSFVGMFNNPFKDLTWREVVEGKQQKIAEKIEESIPSSEQKEIDPLVLSKYSAD